MSDGYARNVVFNVTSGEIRIDGELLPWFYSGGEPTLIKGPDGELLPGLTLTIACSDLVVIAPDKVVSDGA